MPLRCLIYSSSEEIVEPILQVLTDLGIDGEYCQNPVDAVERVTTQLFQIVITDWEDQPEAAFLLKTVRDLKAANRPLALAIVSDDATLPEALRAGANSILKKPIRADQVRDTMRTACELLRSKQPSGQAKVTTRPSQAPDTAARAPVAPTATAAAAGPARMPPSVAGTTEKAFRAGEFLQSSTPKPGAQFDTECDVQDSLEQPAAAQVEALTELEPMAASVKDAAADKARSNASLVGWASLQARRTAPPAPAAPRKNELLSYGEAPSYGVQAVSQNNERATKQSSQDALSEAALFSYLSGESRKDPEPSVERRQNRRRIAVVSALAVTCLVAAAVPQTRQSLRIGYRDALRAAVSWLNPKPVPVPQTVTQHDSFGQEGDEYKLPAVANIPDATTDPSQIRVLPVTDPTAKPSPGSETGGTPAATTENSPAAPSPSGSSADGKAQSVQSPSPDSSTPSGTTAAALAPHDVNSSAVQPTANSPVLPETAPPPRPQPISPPVQMAAPPHQVSSPTIATIPSSLRSQTNSTTPDASGARPVDAGMSSIEPVNLPESIARELLAQPVDPVYPEAAKAGAQHGSVVLQVLVGRDGTVQDTKFTQGSLVFARAAIDAVKQWKFKPYILNGRPVSVQSLITLNFKPPA